VIVCVKRKELDNVRMSDNYLPAVTFVSFEHLSFE
jgi:hypothetical protein